MPARRPRRRLRNALALLGLAIVGWLGWVALTWLDAGALARRPPVTTAFIERWRAAQRQAGRSDRVDRRWVGYEAISPSVKVAVLVAEDINFFSHRGFDGGEIRKALSQALEDGELPRGASSLTQQLAKNLWLSPSRDAGGDPDLAARARSEQAPPARDLPQRRRIRPGCLGSGERQPPLLRQGRRRARR
jgi:monofunctional biosynthetic peptidoglycan transglycosylase